MTRRNGRWRRRDNDNDDDDNNNDGDDDDDDGADNDDDDGEDDDDDDMTKFTRFFPNWVNQSPINSHLPLHSLSLEKEISLTSSALRHLEFKQ